jgi:hypothetical protein
MMILKTILTGIMILELFAGSALAWEYDIADKNPSPIKPTSIESAREVFSNCIRNSLESENLSSSQPIDLIYTQALSQCLKENRDLYLLIRASSPPRNNIGLEIRDLVYDIIESSSFTTSSFSAKRGSDEVLHDAQSYIRWENIPALKGSNTVIADIPEKE